MRLIKCKECRKEISDEAYSCPNCGYQIKNNSNLVRTGSIISLITSSLIIILILSLIIIGIIPQSKNTHEKKDNTNLTVEIELAKGNTIYFENLAYFFISLFFVVGCFIITILYLCGKLKNIIMYKLLLMGMSIIQLITAIMSINALACCGIVYLIFPLINLIGAIIVAIGKIK